MAVLAPEIIEPLPEPVVEFTVTLTVYDLMSEDDKKYVPAAKCCAYYKQEIRRKAPKAKWLEIIVKPAEERRHLIDTEHHIRAKVEVRSNVKNANGFGALTNKGMAFMFELRDDILQVIENFDPPKRAWKSNRVKKEKASGQAKSR